MITRAQRSRVTADIKKNRLVLTLFGTIRKADLESIYTDIRFCVGDLREGFDVITDMRNCRIGYLSGIAVFIKIQQFLRERGVGRVVRIGGRSTSIVQQMQRLTNIGNGYRPVYVQSLEEAEEYLTKDTENPR